MHSLPEGCCAEQQNVTLHHSRLKDNLVRLHIVEEIVAFNCLGQGHDLVEHKTAQC